MPGEKQLASEAQYLQDALKEVSGDEKLGCLSFLFDAREEEIDTADSHTVKKASSSVSAAVDLQRLVGLKSAVYNLLQDNESYIYSLEKALLATRAVGQDLDAMEFCLRQADKAEQEDEAADVLPLQAERVRLPLYPNIYQQVPLLAAQSEEIEQLRLLVSSFLWSSDEDARLKKAVLKQCLRLSTLQLASSSSCPENLLEIVAELSEEELSKVSMPTDRSSKEPIDWTDAADYVGGSHTAEECRTRWLMVDRPGIKQGDWTAEEKDKLNDILQEHIKKTKDGIVCDWESVAQKLDTGRLGIDCFMQSQQENMVPVLTSSSASNWAEVPLSDKEIESATLLHSIWTDEALVAARLGMGRPREQLANLATRSRQPVKRYKWSARADNALMVFIAKECSVKRGQLFAQLDSLCKVDFAKDYRLRPPSISARDVERRWKYLIAQHTKGSLSSSKTKQTIPASQTNCL